MTTAIIIATIAILIAMAVVVFLVARGHSESHESSHGSSVKDIVLAILRWIVGLIIAIVFALILNVTLAKCVDYYVVEKGLEPVEAYGRLIMSFGIGMIVSQIFYRARGWIWGLIAIASTLIGWGMYVEVWQSVRLFLFY